MSKVPMEVDNGMDGSSYVKMDYPSNSHNDKINKANQKGVLDVKKKKRTPVITSGAIRKKKTLGSRFKETFIGEDIDNVGEYIIYDVIVPAVKATVSDLITGSLDMMLFGGTRNHNTTRDKGKSYVSYGAYYKDKKGNNSNNQRQANHKAMHKYDDVVLSSKGDAEEVLGNLVDLTIDYGAASVADLYDMVNMESSFQDHSYGWEDLSSAYVKRVRDGYLIVLPKVTGV